MCNFKRLISLVLVVALVLPAAVSAEQSAVAENVQTGVLYADLQKALNSASKGHTVKLLADTNANNVFINPGRILDLNGFTLTANLISAPFVDSHIIDSQNSEGLLAGIKDYAFNKKNQQLPVWTSEGIRFAEVAIKGQLQPLDANTARYKFYLNMRAEDTIIDDVLKNGSTGTGITIRVRVYCSYPNGMGAEMPFVMSDALVKQYVETWNNSMVILSVTGLANKKKVEFHAEIVSTAPNGTSVVIGI